MAADGSVVIEANLDASPADKALGKLKSKICDVQRNLNEMSTRKTGLEEQARASAAALANESEKLQEIKDRLQEIRNRSKDTSLTPEVRAEAADYKTTVQMQLEEQRAKVQEIRTEYNGINRELDSINKCIEKSTANLDSMQRDAGEMQQHIDEAANSTRELGSNIDGTSTAMERFINRISRLAKRVFVFSLITMALRSLRSWLSSTVKANAEAAQSIAQLKAALLTLAQPIIEVVIPAFIALVNVLTTAVTALAKVVSGLFGKTVAESAEAAKNLNDEKEALEGVGSAAKKAGKSLAAFDEINKLSGDTGGGGASIDADATAPDFTQLLSGKINELAGLFTGLALLVVGAILTFSGANIPLGIALMALGAVTLVSEAKENWEAIAALLQGSIGLVTGIVSVALLAIGAILLFTGASIPLGLGLIVAGAAGLAATIAANWDTIQENLQGPIGEVVAIVSAALLVLGAVLVFTGASIPLGLGLIVAGAAGLAVTIAANWDTVKQKLQGPIGVVTAIISAAVLVLGVILLFTGAGIPLGLGLIAAGAIGLAAAIAPNWNFLVEKVKEVWQSITNWWNEKVAPVFTVDFWKEKFSTISEGLTAKIKDGINAAIALFNKFIGWVNDKLDITWDAVSIAGQEIIPSGHIKLLNIPKIPALAQGAVIPPNREFLAVLGDQKSGQNVEAPAALIKQMVAEALAEAGYGGGREQVIENVLKLDGEVIYRNQQKIQRRHGNNFARA